MRRFPFVLLVFSALALWASAPSLFAQKTTTYSRLQVVPKDVILLNLGGITLDYLNLSYYHRLGDHHAAGAYVGYLYHLIGDKTITGYGYGLSYRYYPAGRSLSRFYYSPTIGVQQAGSEAGVLVSATFGWQWFLEEHFAVGLGGGGRIIFGGSKVTDPATRTAFGASTIITLDLGYGW